jgi:hypothetical protein
MVFNSDYQKSTRSDSFCQWGCRRTRLTLSMVGGADCLDHAADTEIAGLAQDATGRADDEVDGGAGERVVPAPDAVEFAEDEVDLADLALVLCAAGGSCRSSARNCSRPSTPPGPTSTANAPTIAPYIGLGVEEFVGMLRHRHEAHRPLRHRPGTRPLPGAVRPGRSKKTTPSASWAAATKPPRQGYPVPLRPPPPRQHRRHHLPQGPTRGRRPPPRAVANGPQRRKELP